MKEYYIQLFSPHGLIRFKILKLAGTRIPEVRLNMYLELLENLSFHPQVRKVDLFTRRIIDKRVSATL